MTAALGRLAIGIDVGGTAVKAGLVDADGQAVHRESLPTWAGSGVEPFLQRLVDLIKRLQGRAESAQGTVLGVGLGMPGLLSRSRGVVISPPNLPGWRDVPIVERLQEATALPIVLDNDANNAALGEHRCGAGRGVSDLVMLTLGTGIGSGIILDGRLWHGANENAGELGHVIIQPDGRRCPCGQNGCLEAHASASATAARAMELLATGEASSLRDLLAQGRVIDAEAVAQEADRGDALARRAWQETCRCLALGCINIHHALNPQRILLAGGLSAAGATLLEPVREAIGRLASPMLGAPRDVRLAELGNDAGFIGSALSVFGE